MKKISITGKLMPYRGQKFSKDPTQGGKPIGPTLGTVKVSLKEIEKQIKYQTKGVKQ